MAVCSPKFQPFFLPARSRGPKPFGSAIHSRPNQSQEENSSSQTNTQRGNLILHIVNLDTFGYILKFEWSF